jgi:hypothetical protein
VRCLTQSDTNPGLLRLPQSPCLSPCQGLCTPTACAPLSPHTQVMCRTAEAMQAKCVPAMRASALAGCLAGWARQGERRRQGPVTGIAEQGGSLTHSLTSAGDTPSSALATASPTVCTAPARSFWPWTGCRVHGVQAWLMLLLLPQSLCSRIPSPVLHHPPLPSLALRPWPQRSR